MTLPSSGPITSAQIAAELGVSSFTIPSPEIRALTGVASGPILCPDDFWGKPSGGGGGTASGTFLAVSNQLNGSSLSFTGTSFGTAAANRRVFCFVHWNYSGEAHFSVTSATIGGVSATIHTQGGFAAAVNGPNGFGAAIISAVVPTGTSGTVVVNFTSTVNASISTFRVVELQNGSPTDSDSDANSGSTGNLSLNISVASGGLLFVVYHAGNGGGAAYNSMVGAAERYNGAGPNNGVGGFNTNLSAQTRAVSVNASSITSTGNLMLALTWS